MGQKRYFDYFSDATSSGLNVIQYVTHDKGVYRGMDLIIDTQDLYVDAGYSLQHDGVMWYESDRVSLTFIPPALQTNYTVVATHDNRNITGGVGVLYEVRIGIFTNSDITNGIVLGWIYHPGLTLPLDQSYVQSAPKAMPGAYASEYVDRAPIELIPTYPRSIVTSAGVDIVFTACAFDPADFCVYQSVRNNSLLVTETLVQQIQFYVNKNIRPTSFDFYFRTELAGGSNMVVEVHGTDLLSVPVTGSPVTGNALNTRENKTVSVDRTLGTFTTGMPYTLRLTYNVGPGKEIQIGRIKANFWPYQ